MSVALFTIVALALYLKLRRTRKELDGLFSTDRIGPDGTRVGRVDAREEEHLIEMIRKNTPVMALGQVA